MGGAEAASIGPFTSEELERFGVSHRVSEGHTVAGSPDAPGAAPGRPYGIISYDDRRLPVAE